MLHLQRRAGDRQTRVSNVSSRNAVRLTLVMAHAAAAWLCYSMGMLHCATFAMGPTAHKATSTRVSISVAAEVKPSGNELAQLQEIMNGPEKMKLLQESVKQMMQDPEKKGAFETLQQSMTSVAERLQAGPELESVFKDIKENGMDALEKYQDNESVMKKMAAAQAELKNDLSSLTPEREVPENLINEIFSKFDVDKDGFLNLDEFNALQTATEGTEAAYDAAQLEELLKAVDPNLEDPERGMPFKMYRRLYVDRILSQTYNTDAVRDHAKIFGA